mmetsp:Transcript_48235/g.84847  ORF Transcript_48235/g.84847 Transcript_48235/m.84847 type:complete len:484 (-) Transcript_48235:151-1602(-)
MAKLQYTKSKEELFATLTVGLVCWVCNVAVLLPLSIFYHHHTAWKVFWWISWILSIPTGFIALWVFCYFPAAQVGRGDFSPGPSSGLICMTLCPIGLWPAFLLAGWWLLANHSKSMFAEIKRDVEPESIAEMYNSDDPPDAYLMEYGYLSSLPVQGSQSLRYMASSFSFKCHGYYISQTCTGEQCSECCCDANGLGCSQTCHTYEYECGYWEYPADCIGYDLVSAAPVYEDTIKDGSNGQKPSAIAYQVRTYLFDQDASRMNAHYQSMLNQPFPARYCADSKICLLDLRSFHIEDYWSDYANWEKTVIDDPGKNKYEDLNAENGRKLATRMITMSGQTHGIPLTHAPLLWMPPGVRETFEDFEKSLKDSEEDGKAAKILIPLATVVPGGLMIICFCFIAYTSPWTPGGNCWDRILCLKSETKVELVKRQDEDPQPDPEKLGQETNEPTNVEPYKPGEDKLRHAATGILETNEPTNAPTSAPTN